MRVITSAHANTWHMVIMLAMLASTQLSFRAAMKPVSVRGELSMRRGFLISAPHHLPLHHPPPPRYVYFLMLYIICFTSNLSISNHHIYLSSTFIRAAHREPYHGVSLIATDPNAYDSITLITTDPNAYNGITLIITLG